MKFLLVLVVTLCTYSTLQADEALWSSAEDAADRAVHYIGTGESIVIGDDKVVCRGGGGPSVTSCSARAQYTGELCCQISCYYPKVARCRPPNHPSICRGAACYCAAQ